jgi:hypothetical protein
MLAVGDMGRCRGDVDSEVGPAVRIRFPPAASLRTIGPSAADGPKTPGDDRAANSKEVMRSVYSDNWLPLLAGFPDQAARGRGCRRRGEDRRDAWR